jgi:hypothetical protein
LFRRPKIAQANSRRASAAIADTAIMDGRKSLAMTVVVGGSDA